MVKGNRCLLTLAPMVSGWQYVLIGGIAPPPRFPKLLERFPNFKRHSIALDVNSPNNVRHLTLRSLMTSQVRSKSIFSSFRA